MTQKNSIAKIAHQNSEGNAPSSITSKEAPLSPEMLSQWKDKSATAEDSSDQQPHQERVLDTTENSKKTLTKKFMHICMKKHQSNYTNLRIGQQYKFARRALAKLVGIIQKWKGKRCIETRRENLQACQEDAE
jgi:hypothetical protein